VQSCGGYRWFPSVSDAGVMTSFTHDTAPTRYAGAGGTQFAYRRFGSPGRPPLVFFQHFMGNLDDHDPALSDAFADALGLTTIDVATARISSTQRCSPAMRAPSSTTSRSG
jgi:hypothetical protein